MPSKTRFPELAHRVDGGVDVTYHVDVTVGDQPVRAIEVIGEPDPAGSGYLPRSFDGERNADVMHLTIDHDGVFHFVGWADIAPAARLTDTTRGKVGSRSGSPRIVDR